MTGEAPPLPRFDTIAAAELRKLASPLRACPASTASISATAVRRPRRRSRQWTRLFALGRSMAARAPVPADPAQGKRRRRPLRMTPKAINRRKMKAHNYRLRARALKKQRKDS